MLFRSLPVRVARALGATTVVLTAATGGIGQGLDTGHLVVGSDHINLLGQSPLRGWRRPDGSPPFVDMVGAYDDALAGLAVAAARNRGIPVSRGVYAAMPGPMYETPAEIGFLRTIGASVVGMSVVPEAVPARALGMRVLGLFFVTNQVGVEVRHEDVVRASDAMAGSIGEVIAEVLAKGKWSVGAARTAVNLIDGFTNVVNVPASVAYGAGRQVELFGSVRTVTRIDRDLRPIFTTDPTVGGIAPAYPLVSQGWKIGRAHV